jgi:hypothetical protein
MPIEHTPFNHTASDDWDLLLTVGRRLQDATESSHIHPQTENRE